MVTNDAPVSFSYRASWLRGLLSPLALALSLLCSLSVADAAEPVTLRLQSVAAERLAVRPPERSAEPAARLTPIHFYREQLQQNVPADAPAYRNIWQDCGGSRTRAQLMATPRSIRAAEPGEAVRMAGCGALVELHCAVASPQGVRSEAIPGFHLIRLPDGRFRLATAGHVLTFSVIRAQRHGGALVFERDCVARAGDGVPLTGMRLSAPHFIDPGVTAATMTRADADFWSSEPHDTADLGYFDVSFDALPAAQASRALVAAIALRTYAGPTIGLAPYGAAPVCSFGTGFMGNFESRVRISGCVAAGGVEMQASRLEEGRCRFRAPTTAYFSGAPLVGMDEQGPLALCVISSEPGSEPSSPIAGGVPLVEPDHARRYSPGLANNGVLYPAD